MEKQNLADTVKHAATAMSDAAHDPMAAADQNARQAGETLTSAADQLRARIPEGGTASEMADAVTSGVEQAATYMQEQGLERLIEDVIAVARRYPLQTLLLGLGCGFLLSRLRRT